MEVPISTELLFQSDPYGMEAESVIIAHSDDGGVIIDRSIFYPAGGGQPGDSGMLSWSGGRVHIAEARKSGAGRVVLLPAAADPLPAVGTRVHLSIDWARRHRHMRVHTALHLLSVVLPFPVTGGQITEDKGRLDFMMPTPAESKVVLEARLNELIGRDLPVTSEWITVEELEAAPELVKTMSVAPPVGEGRVRLVRIGEGGTMIDLQPCGGTHVARTSEIGGVRIGKIENKGKNNRRVAISLCSTGVSG